MTISINIPLQPRGLFLFCWQKSKQKTMSAVSASLKIGYTSLKIRNLSPFHSAFEQTDFLRFVPPIFLTLTSQGGNQGMLTSCRELKVRQRRCVKKRIPSSRDSVINIASINLQPLFPLFQKIGDNSPIVNRYCTNAKHCVATR